MCHVQVKFYPVLDFNFLLNGENVKFYRKKKGEIRSDGKAKIKNKNKNHQNPKTQTKQKFQNQTKPNSSGKLLVRDKEQGK